MLSARPIDMALYAKCPKKCQYLWGYEKTITPESQLIQTVIKKTFEHHLRLDKIASWRKIRQWIQDIIINTGYTFTNEYEETKNLLTKLSNWYNLHYLEDYTDVGFINFPVRLELGSHFILKDTIDIVSIGDQIRLFDFDEVDDWDSLLYYNGLKLYNNIEVLSRIWAFNKLTGQKVDEYIRFVNGQGTIKAVKIRELDKILEQTDGMVRQITQGIKSNVFYPSFSKECINCPFKKGCSI